MVTTEKVQSIDTSSLGFAKNRPCATTSKYLRLILNRNNGTNNKACRKPQNTNVQFAPCQKPLTIKIIKMFLKARAFEPRLPPKGTYK